jgi:hypothetical protein
MEELVDAMATISLDDAAATTLGMFLDHIPWISEEHARFHNLNRLLETFSSCLNYAHRVFICPCFLTHVICFIQIAMKAFMIKCDVEVQNIAFKKDSLIGYTVTDNLIGRRAD